MVSIFFLFVSEIIEYVSCESILLFAFILDVVFDYDPLKIIKRVYHGPTSELSSSHTCLSNIVFGELVAVIVVVLLM